MHSDQERKILNAWSLWQEFLARLGEAGLGVKGASFECREGGEKAPVVELFGHLEVP